MRMERVSGGHGSGLSSASLISGHTGTVHYAHREEGDSAEVCLLLSERVFRSTGWSVENASTRSAILFLSMLLLLKEELDSQRRSAFTSVYSKHPLLPWRFSY